MRKPRCGLRGLGSPAKIWVVALVGITHMVASIVLGWLVWKGLDDKPDGDPDRVAGP